MGVAALVLIWLLYPKDFDYTGGIADNVTYFKVFLCMRLDIAFLVCCMTSSACSRQPWAWQSCRLPCCLPVLLASHGRSVPAEFN